MIGNNPFVIQLFIDINFTFENLHLLRRKQAKMNQSKMFARSLTYTRGFGIQATNRNLFDSEFTAGIDVIAEIHFSERT